MESASGGGSDCSTPGEKPQQWHFIEHWQKTLQQSAVLERGSMFGLHQAVQGGYLPKCWLEEHWPGVAKQLTVLLNHKAAAERGGLRWDWDKYVAHVSQRASLPAREGRSRSPVRQSGASASAAAASESSIGAEAVMVASGSSPSKWSPWPSASEPHRHILPGFWDGPAQPGGGL